MKNKYQTLILALSLTVFLIVTLIYMRSYIFDNVSQDNLENGPVANVTITGKAVKDQQIKFYLDVNRNFTRDEEEDLCEKCREKKALVLLDGVNGIEVANRDIDSEGNLEIGPDDKLIKIWGFYSEDQLLIPNFEFISVPENEDILVPVFVAKVDISGVNAGIAQANREDLAENTHYTTYLFTELLPVFKTAKTNQQQVWVKFTPDLQQPETYYLAENIIRESNDIGEVGTNYLSVTWEFPEPLSGFRNYELLRFIVVE